MDENWKQNFIDKLLSFERKENHLNLLTREEFDKLIKEVEDAKIATKKTPTQYRRLKRFDVVLNGEVKQLVSNKKKARCYLPVEDIFDIVESVHIAVEHGGRDRMKAELSRKYANITTEMINVFLSMCEACRQKKNKNKKNANLKSNESELESRCQINLIDMQTQPDHQYKFVLVYEDVLTKFVLLRALKSKMAADVAFQLTDIFLTFGAPCIMYSANGPVFVNSVIKKIANLWPALKLVQGNLCENLGLIEVPNLKEIKTMIARWMKDSRTSNWSNGLRHIQFMKNKTYHSGIKETPYKALFGIEPRIGLTTSNLPPEVIKNIHSEMDLRKAISGSKKRKVDNEMNENPDQEKSEPSHILNESTNSEQDNESLLLLQPTKKSKVN